MKDQLQTIRADLSNLMHLGAVQRVIDTVAQLEAMAGEPVAYLYASIAGPVVLHRLQQIGHAKPLYFQDQLENDLRAQTEYPDAHSCVPLYAAPVAQQPQAEAQDVGQLEYRGNSVAFIYQKMTAYRSAVDAAWQAMRDTGHPPDGCTPLAQAITKALAPQQPQARPDFTDEWTGYLKDGETPFERFLRERRDTQSALKLYQRALEENERLKAQQPQAEPDWINGVPHWSPALIAKVKQMAAELDEPEQPQAECRNDGRCQYAIDSGAEGLGHCPKGKCVMQQSHAKTAEVFHCKTCGCTMQMPHDDCLACERGAPQQAEAVPCGGRDYCARFPFCGCGDSGSLPERDKAKPAEQQGLFRKFVVRRTDGSDAPGGKHDGCDYFVLDVTHDKHARAALAAYAASVEETHPQLALDMRSRYELAAPQQAEAVPSDVVRDAVAAEREACAALAQGYAGQVGDVAWAVAAAIRGRGNAAIAQQKGGV